MNEEFGAEEATSCVAEPKTWSDASFTHVAQCTIHPDKLYKLASVCEGLVAGDHQRLAAQEVTIFARQIRGFAVYAHWCYRKAYGVASGDDDFFYRKIHFLNGACTSLDQLMRSPNDVEEFFIALGQSTVQHGEVHTSPFFLGMGWKTSHF